MTTIRMGPDPIPSPTTPPAQVDAAHSPSHHGPVVPHGHQVSLEVGLDFVNTLEYDRDKVIEHLPDTAAAMSWFFDHELLHREARDELVARMEADAAAGQRALRRIVRVRAALRDLLDASVERRPPAARELTEVNRALRAHYVTYLVPATDGVSLDHRHEGDPIEGALGRLTESIARELTQGRPDRLRVCENPECRWVFMDTSHSGRRKWCDMRTCGNRVKVARHRQRRREEQGPEGVADSPA